MVLPRPPPSPLFARPARSLFSLAPGCRALHTGTPRSQARHVLGGVGGKRTTAWNNNSSNNSKTGLGRAQSVNIDGRRLLTTTRREKVKVLQVLYDGGKHAEDVSLFSSSFLLPFFGGGSSVCTGWGGGSRSRRLSCRGFTGEPSPPEMGGGGGVRGRRDGTWSTGISSGSSRHGGARS